ncbi:hypothetical protein [Haliangium ochraceum]|uniref:hypothetical protein n=1 Tax=Haliangium ochraceum TaxID=80816 RepID=UPI00019BA138|nr:hypothetical protein [Haliangium ochraceum]
MEYDKEDNMSKRTLPKAARDNRANQLNPAHAAYHRARGASTGQADAHAARASADGEGLQAPLASVNPRASASSAKSE